MECTPFAAEHTFLSAPWSTRMLVALWSSLLLAHVNPLLNADEPRAGLTSTRGLTTGQAGGYSIYEVILVIFFESELSPGFSRLLSVIVAL